jgi:hypothetical protein
MGVYGMPNVLLYLTQGLIIGRWQPTYSGGWPLQYGRWEYLNVTLDDIADCCIYDEWAQELLSFAGYWRGENWFVRIGPIGSYSIHWTNLVMVHDADPYAIAEYVETKILLSDMNNERAEKNPVYKQRVLSLENFIMSYSTIDEVNLPPAFPCTLVISFVFVELDDHQVLIPRETGWFGSFANNSVNAIVPLEEQPMYKYDWVGLR